MQAAAKQGKRKETENEREWARAKKVSCRWWEQGDECVLTKFYRLNRVGLNDSVLRTVSKDIGFEFSVSGLDLCLESFWVRTH